LSINNLLYTRRPTNYEIFDGQSLRREDENKRGEEKMRTREREKRTR
jgi:hypothetical protein